MWSRISNLFFIPASCIAKEYYFALICVIIGVTGVGNSQIIIVDRHFIQEKKWILAVYKEKNIHLDKHLWHYEWWKMSTIFVFQSKTKVHSFKKNSNFAGIIANLKKSYKIKQKEIKENKWRKRKKQIGEMQPWVFGL